LGNWKAARGTWDDVLLERSSPEPNAKKLFLSFFGPLKILFEVGVVTPEDAIKMGKQVTSLSLSKSPFQPA
jgi:hypothetical protein